MGINQNTFPVTLGFSSDGKKRLDALKENSKASNYTEVIGQSLLLLDALVSEQQDGGAVFYVKYKSARHMIPFDFYNWASPGEGEQDPADLDKSVQNSPNNCVSLRGRSASGWNREMHLVSFDLPYSALQRLPELQDILELEYPFSVIPRALELYSGLLHEMQANTAIFYVMYPKEGHPVPFDFFDWEPQREEPLPVNNKVIAFPGRRLKL